MDSGDGGPYLGSDQEETFRQEDDADGPRNLISCLAENGGVLFNIQTDFIEE